MCRVQLYSSYICITASDRFSRPCKYLQNKWTIYLGSNLLYLPQKVTTPKKSVPAILEKSVGPNVGKKMDIATGVTGMDFAVEKAV